MPELLIELLSEEIPARMQARAAAELKKRMTAGLAEAGLRHGEAEAFATPRRLALVVRDVAARSPTLREERRGPRADAPEKAVAGFLRSVGLSRDRLEIRDTPKGPTFFAVIERPGRAAAEIVAEVLEGVIRGFPWPKSMRWGSGTLRWVRPLHSILCILSDEQGARVVDLEVDGIRAGDRTRGHRFMAPEEFSVVSFEDYEAKLRQAKVILPAAERAARIRADADSLAFAAGLEVIADAGLLDEVAGLVEWPVALMGEIGEAFLELPPEVLRTSMKEHQKFFSVRNPQTGRIERFVTVANRETADDGAAILAGNRRVLAARLADARFFWENDLRVAREDILRWVRALDGVTFHNRLGSQGARVRRIVALAAELAVPAGADPALTREAAELAKADLCSEMVYEFPELQGVMGRYYVTAAGRDPAVAAAAEEHYRPQGPADAVPAAPVSVAVGLADRIDMLTGFWAIDEKPTGSRDPFALRRAALGVIRLILGNDLRLPLRRFIDGQLMRHKRQLHRGAAAAEREALIEITREIARHGFFGAAFEAVMERLRGRRGAPDLGEGSLLRGLGGRVPELSDDLLGFIHERLKVFLREEGIRHDIIDACIVMPGSDDLSLLVRRARALQAVMATGDGENLLQGFRRANNILTQAEAADGVSYSFGADPRHAESESERALFAALAAAEERISAALAAEDFAAAMAEMAALRGPIDAFFEEVQVNTDNALLRRNRLNLLHDIRSLCLKVADLTRLEG